LKGLALVACSIHKRSSPLSRALSPRATSLLPLHLKVEMTLQVSIRPNSIKKVGTHTSSAVLHALKFHQEVLCWPDPPIFKRN